MVGKTEGSLRRAERETVEDRAAAGGASGGGAGGRCDPGASADP